MPETGTLEPGILYATSTLATAAPSASRQLTGHGGGGGAAAAAVSCAALCGLDCAPWHGQHTLLRLQAPNSTNSQTKPLRQMGTPIQAQARPVAARVASPIKEEWNLTQFTCEWDRSLERRV
jgi:hypothetical protein